jgi:hypothetical protein
LYWFAELDQSQALALTAHRRKVLGKKSNLRQNIQLAKEARIRIEKQTANLDKEYEEILAILTPSQRAKFAVSVFRQTEANKKAAAAVKKETMAAKK